MNREEATQALELLRRVVTQARDDTALQNWGLIWMVHAFLNGGGFLATDALWARGLREPGPYMLLWGVLLGCNFASIFFMKRGQTAGVRSFIERQIWAIWTSFIGCMVLVAVLNLLLGLDRLFFPSVACVLFAMAFCGMGALMGRGWYAMAALFGLVSLGMTRVPEHAFGVLGGLWFLVQFCSGLALHRARIRRIAAEGLGPRLV
ncbi:hypothetical protein DRW03_08960 [Corallococcus sp. H22C18031201]|uniref:hypothetical protein n=1 Tax=Citreicoccus inhibens TaxID=2849499 RepID=UPI000E72B500|nr:hypothetical protein [Citreicoccus inhibens]MBU8894638.1 hypothetical protein [Citreicoccus inhibens]RJS25223.1 hypothetical protein DRW03_08960 [Corallococcus sp. H22C18031201]